MSHVFLPRLLSAVALISCFSSSLAMADTSTPSSAELRKDKTYHMALIDGPTMEGGARIGIFLGSDTLVNFVYLEEKNLFENDYSSRSRSLDLGVQQFLGNSFYASLAFRRMQTHSTNNDFTEPQILLWQRDNLARLAFGNQWQLVENVTVGIEWINLGANLQRLNHSSEIQGYLGSKREEAALQAHRDERKANRFFYNALHVELGYSF